MTTLRIMPGDRLKVVNVEDVKTAKGRLPFAKGAELTCDKVKRGLGGEVYVGVKGHIGWFKGHRFEVVHG